MNGYSCGLAPYMEGLVAQKKALGYSFSYGEKVLRRFDAFCIEKYPGETTLTREMGMEWAIMLPDEKAISTAKRIAPVRELAKYMLRQGIESYVIPNEFVKQPNVRYAPHIFTDDELERFFHAADILSPPQRKVKKDSLAPYVMPVLFRLTYTCGLRPWEGRTAKRTDIDLENGMLFIPDSKRHKDRIVTLSDDMVSLCRQYEEFIQAKVPDCVYFFPASATTCYSSNSFGRYFNRCLDIAGIAETACGNKPRIYDFRHTFATKTLYKWIKAGRDIDSCLPFLSAYMGHAHLSQTAYYIHLVPEIFPTLSKMDWKNFSSLIPEADHDEI